MIWPPEIVLLASLFLLLSSHVPGHRLPFEAKSEAEVRLSEWQKPISEVTRIAGFDKTAWTYRDHLAFKLMDLPWMSVLILGHDTLEGETTPTCIDSWCRAERVDGDHPHGLSTACEIQHDVKNYYTIAGSNPEGDNYCIFPSISLEGQGVYFNPYYGGMDCASFTVGPKREGMLKFKRGFQACYCSATYEKFAHLAQTDHRACAYGFRCLFNKKYHYHKEPNIDLARPYSMPLHHIFSYDAGALGSYVLHDHFSMANEYCFWAYCDPFIYIRLTNAILNDYFGGYYVIEPHEQVISWDANYQMMGFSHYRHINRQRFITFTKANVMKSPNGNYPMIGSFEKSEHVKIEMRDMDWTEGTSKPQIYADLKDKEMFAYSKIYVTMAARKNPSNQNYFCLRGLLENGYLEKEWKWAKENSFGENYKSTATEVIIERGSGPPLRAPCGVGFRPSENYQLNTGRQPWHVYVVLGGCRRNLPKCSGTVVSPRHVVTAASCLCSHVEKNNIFARGSGQKCSWGTEGGDQYKFVHYDSYTSLDKQVCVFTGEVNFQNHQDQNRDIYGRKLRPTFHKVLWVSFHESYRKNHREYDIAVLGLKWSLQFSAVLAPICLPDPQSSDSNNLPKGVLLYSIKALQTTNEYLVDGTILPYTNANGHSIYEECQTNCTTEESLENYLKNLENSNLPDVFYTFPQECQQFWKDFRDPDHDLRSRFHHGWIEPQSIVKLSIIEENTKPKSVTCYDIRPSSYNRAGWCKTMKKESFNRIYHASWGFCDDSSLLRLSPTLVEVETTLVPEEDCDVRPPETDSAGNQLVKRTLTKICTSYLPHKPSVYEVERRTHSGGKFEYKVIRYLGGYYRDFIPKRSRRKKILRYDNFGQPIMTDIRPQYHAGFPRKHQICHPNDIDVGAATYARLARLHEFNLDTRDTTQEPSGQGISHNVLIAIQSGHTGYGKFCNLHDGSYADVETVLTAELVSFIEANVESLEQFANIFDVEDYKVKSIGQSITGTPDPLLTTTIENVVNFDLGDWLPFDPDKLPPEPEETLQ